MRARAGARAGSSCSVLGVIAGARAGSSCLVLVLGAHLIVSVFQ